MIAALYTVLTILLAPILYGPVQCRVSEALTLLPFYFPEAVPGLFIGCVISNFIGGIMADRFKYSEVRQKIIDAIRTDLIGPREKEDF